MHRPLFIKPSNGGPIEVDEKTFDLLVSVQCSLKLIFHNPHRNFHREQPLSLPLVLLLLLLLQQFLPYATWLLLVPSYSFCISH